MKVPKITQLPSGSYFCRVRINKQDVPITGDTYDEVFAKAVAVKGGLIKQKKAPPSITIGDAIDEFIKENRDEMSASTVKAYMSYRRNRFKGLIDKSVASLSVPVLRKAVTAEVREGLSAKYIENAFMLLRSAVRPHVDIEWDEIKLPEDPEQEPEALTEEQLAKVLSEIKGSAHELPILLAAWMGLRRSEIYALKFKDFNRERGTLRIHDALVPGENGNVLRGKNKTVKSTRTIGCPEYIFNIVDAIERKSDDEPVLKTHPNSSYNFLSRLCKREGFSFKVGLQALRHQNASIMLILNFPDKYAMKRGGWSTPAVMKQRYQNIMADQMKEKVKELDLYMAKMVAGDRIGNENDNEK